MTVITYEKSVRGEACREILEQSALAESYDRLILLPIPTSRDGVHVAGTDITLKQVTDGCTSECLVIGYEIPEPALDAIHKSGADVCDVATDEKFLERNAELTATATLSVILRDVQRDPTELDIGIVGYGRIGKRLTRILLHLGATVRVYTTKRDVALCLGGSGVNATVVKGGDTPLAHDLLINTAPARIFDTSADFPRKMRVLELTSGDNFPGVEIQRLPALPKEHFPISAGHAWAESVLRLAGGER